MRNIHGILSILLALMLASSNVAFAGHVSSHAPTDAGLCSLCIHAGGADSVVAPDSGALFAIPAALNLKPGRAPALFLPVILHDQQSRAPPSIS